MTSKSDSDGNPNDSKEVAFYAACLQAWINARMERYRQLIMLLSLALGLLVIYREISFCGLGGMGS